VVHQQRRLRVRVEPSQPRNRAPICLRGTSSASSPHTQNRIARGGRRRMILVELLGANSPLSLLFDGAHHNDHQPPRRSGSHFVSNLNATTGLCHHTVDRHVFRFTGQLSLASRFVQSRGTKPSVDSSGLRVCTFAPRSLWVAWLLIGVGYLLLFIGPARWFCRRIANGSLGQILAPTRSKLS
jgi:hypothetical protein